MISVITPTMWKYNGFPQNILATLNDSFVDEYIIINNDVAATPETDILSHPKIKMFNFKENTYVNPAWNFGVSVAQNEILAFLSDDVEFDSIIFSKTYELIEKTENIGIIGVLTRYANDPRSAKIYDDYLTDGSVSFMSEFPTATFGAFFFMLKKQWKNIPEKLKIVNGDCLQYNRCHILEKKNFMAVNCKCESPWHVTLNGIPREVIDDEELLFREINENTDWAYV